MPGTTNRWARRALQSSDCAPRRSSRADSVRMGKMRAPGGLLATIHDRRYMRFQMGCRQPFRASNKTPDVENHIGFYLTICIRVCQVTRNQTVLFRGILQREIFQEASHAASKLTTADPHLYITGLCFQCALRLLDDPGPLHPGGRLPVRLGHHVVPCLGCNGGPEADCPKAFRTRLGLVEAKVPVARVASYICGFRRNLCNFLS